MLKSIKPNVWAFDAEWVPDVRAGRLVYNLPEDFSDNEVLQEMWKRGGATAEDPQPFLKLSLCRVVSIAAVVRKVAKDGEVSLDLLSLPKSFGDYAERTEASILGRFLTGVGRYKPQLVGYNSVNADIKIFVQRAIINGLCLPEFASRPDKPWEGVDYFAKETDFHIDLFNGLTGYGRGGPSLHEMAVQCGIPGKIGLGGSGGSGFTTKGEDVPVLWFKGDYQTIVKYNECDALTTYLLWLRIAHFCGFFDAEGYAKEILRVESLIESRVAKCSDNNSENYSGNYNSEDIVRDNSEDISENRSADVPVNTSVAEHLVEFLKEWRRLRG